MHEGDDFGVKKRFTADEIGVQYAQLFALVDARDHLGERHVAFCVVVFRAVATRQVALPGHVDLCPQRQRIENARYRAQEARDGEGSLCLGW
jgi:hypothetical protein